MNVWSYLACGSAAVVVTSIELACRNQRHPFGDRKFKAAGWWLAVAIIDVAVALLTLAGAVSIEILDPSVVSNSNKILQGIAVGVFGPLALRSPVRKTQVHDHDTQVGVTYVYDVARLYAAYALDDRFVQLKRRDVVAMKGAWLRRGLDSRLVAAAIQRHLNDHERLEVNQRERVVKAVENSLTLPSEDQCMIALIKLIRQERFASLVDELGSYELGSIEIEEPTPPEPALDDDFEVVEDEVASP